MSPTIDKLHQQPELVVNEIFSISNGVKRALLTMLFFFCLGANVIAVPGPGDIFREYKWTGPYINGGNFQRVTDPDATHEGAQQFLPNPVNSITLDTTGAIKIEAYIQRLQCHVGTSNKRIRVNGNSWIEIPEAAAIPSSHPECYMTMIYPTVEIPLSHFNDGYNTFEFTTDGQICYDFGWGQWLCNGVTFRVYYDSSHPHPTGAITTPAAGATIGENPTISASASGSGGYGIKQVDFIGYYEDFNFEGDNIWRQWHIIQCHGDNIKHLGSDTTTPYSVIWDTSWVPDQQMPIKIMARIVDTSNMVYMTEAADNITLQRQGISVKLYKCYDVPEQWVSRSGSSTDTCHLDIFEDLTNAVAAKMYLCSWSGYYAQGIGINGYQLVYNIGRLYDISYDEINVPISCLVPGQNTPYTYSATVEHGIEVQWPGLPLKVRYLVPPVGDFTKDLVVDLEDVKVLTNDWLTDEFVLDGLVSYYKFDGNASDSTGGNDGTEVGNPTYAQGMHSQAIGLDGDGDYVNCGNNASFDITAAITISAWIKGTFNNTLDRIIEKGYNWMLCRGYGDNAAFYCLGFGILEGSVTVNDNQWHHIAGVYNGYHLVLYVDGVADGVKPASGSLKVSTANVYIGGNTSKSFNGLIDEVRIYSRALSAGEIRTLYSGPVTDLVSDFKIDFKDFAVQANHWLEDNSQ